MDRERVAGELIRIAKDLVSRDRTAVRLTDTGFDIIYGMISQWSEETLDDLANGGDADDYISKLSKSGARESITDLLWDDNDRELAKKLVKVLMERKMIGGYLEEEEAEYIVPGWAKMSDSRKAKALEKVLARDRDKDDLIEEIADYAVY